MKKLDYDIIPLIISVVLILVSLFVVFTSKYVFDIKHYLGLTSVIISAYFYYKNRMTYYLVFGMSLLVGIFGLVGFYYSTFKVGFGSFGINPIMMGLLVLHISLIFQMVDKLDSNK
ncbi:hypothetical protein [uncultured Dokdonia sp.]|uniref:hypothetical protein n=1 Tax=uncultured Dokdonia sp. TaxID=575653 RepID=UPI002610E852|nr:hypothetical protein [uncultured Dokdonia sp.]